MKLLLHGLNFSPEEIGIGKYSGEMIDDLSRRGVCSVVVTTPPYYPHWEIGEGFSGARYSKEVHGDDGLAADGERDSSEAESHWGRVEVWRCPVWVPAKVTGLKRVIHLASYALTSAPIVLWKALVSRPDVIMTVEPAAMCMPTTWLAARLCGAKAWLHVQDFEVDAAFELGILKNQFMKRCVLAVEAFLMRRFDRVSSISPNMMLKLHQKGVRENAITALPNWVDCEVMRPLEEDYPDEYPEIRAAFRAELRARFDLPAEKCIALYAGNVGKKQGLEIIIEAAKQTAERSDLHYVIAGHGAAYDELVALSAGLPNVQWLPLQPLERFNEMMNCADIHLLPQRGGAADLVMPSKLTGMLATGRAIVTCADPGTQIADVVDGHGLVVPPSDSVAFAEAICQLADDESLRGCLGRAARKYAIENLSRNAILSQLMVDLHAVCGLPLEATTGAIDDERFAVTAS
ncbi:glycosyltransferase WbuB [Rhodopirellula sp. MGV]|uniref:glycosyltransferase WbuB n=1 Tax=Rhodopirellula sp. MGV TaxID=2023130 RepID=UPI000B9634DD|nr:glycosyltransferase WbuB [Rhodopirellula sp. MGV]OYP34093.1 colanic acid biosynthesis glycosyltransferase WcaI [Rhodopirellula sp. MGV]PNY35606.1 colanic acid biosynthesis glycosyltransferase WcaI [Rhodopirellula baltica]